MVKIDFSKQFRPYYTAKNKPEIMEIKASKYLAIEGRGDPSSEAYANRIQALYAVAYNLKFVMKAAGQDFTVAKLEGQWWYDEAQFGSVGFMDAPTKIPRHEWQYRMLIRMPHDVTAEQVKTMVKYTVDKKGIAAAQNVKLHQTQNERVVQMLHVGPFDTEPETLAVMVAFMEENGLEKNGPHQEIYLSDFRRTAPEKLKTILREPIKWC